MAAAQKYLFDLSFDGPAGAATAPAAPRAPVAPPEPTFSPAELAAAEEKARAEGHAAGTAQAISRYDQQIGDALSVIADGAGTLLAAKNDMQREGERLAIELARSVLGKLFPALAKCNGLAEIAALVAGCMRECIDEPRLVVRVPDALFEGVQQRVAPLAGNSGFPGKLVILADEALTGSDCRVEWADGGAERDMARTWRDIEAAMIRALASAGETNDPPQQAPTGES